MRGTPKLSRGLGLLLTLVFATSSADERGESKAVLSMRGVRHPKPERLPAVEPGQTATLVAGLPAVLPGGIVLVSDKQLTPQQLEAPVDWPSEIEVDEEGYVRTGTPEAAPTAPRRLRAVEANSSSDDTTVEITDAEPRSVPQVRMARRSTTPTWQRKGTAEEPSSLSPEPISSDALSILEERPAPTGDTAFSPDQPLHPLQEADGVGDGGGELLDEQAIEHRESTPVRDEIQNNVPTSDSGGSDSNGDAPRPALEPEFDFDKGANPEILDAPRSEPEAPISSVSEAFSADSRWSSGMHTSGSQSTTQDLAFTWSVPEQINLGEQATCRLRVENGGTSTAHAVQVRVELPKHVRLAATDPEPNVSGHPLTWKIARLESGEFQEILLAVIPTAEGNLTPSASVTSTRLAQASIAILKPQLEVRVEGNDQLSLGQPASYRLVVQNTGSGVAANVQLAARLSEGLHHPQGQQVQYRIGTLAAGQSREVQLPLTGMQPGSFQIEALVASGNRLAAESKREVEVVKPTLHVALTGPKLRYVDRKATYLLKVHNPGPAPADNVQLIEQLPQGLRYLEATPGGSFDPQLRQVAWFVGRLEPKQTAEVGIHVLAEVAGDHTLAAVAKADSGVSAKAKTTTKVEGVSLVVLDVIDRDDPIESGSVTAYEIRVTNRGSEPAHHVQVAARLPETMAAVQATGASEATIEGHQVVFESLETLAPGQSQAFVVQVKCLKAGTARFQAFFRSDEEPKALLQEETTRVYGE